MANVRLWGKLSVVKPSCTQHLLAYGNIPKIYKARGSWWCVYSTTMGKGDTPEASYHSMRMTLPLEEVGHMLNVAAARKALREYYGDWRKELWPK